MRCTAWNNGSWCDSGAGYGLKLSITDRDTNFSHDWNHVVLELPRASGASEVMVNTNKKSFWSKTCRELISKEIGVWLIENSLAPWPKGSPPILELTPVGNNRFRVTRIRGGNP